MNPLIQFKKAAPVFVVALVCFGLLPTMHAVSPAPDGGYPGQNTAEGQNALLSCTTGAVNTAIGFFSLRALTTGNFCTGVGAGTLLANTADRNPATGAWALLSNTTGGFNTAVGAGILLANTSVDNTATGAGALLSNTTSGLNTAHGVFALFSNTTGSDNTAIGIAALQGNTTGSGNIALGVNAGFSVTTANNIICIGADGNNVDNSCYIGNIFGSPSSNGVAVLVNSNGRLGTMTSSARFKDEIKPMDKASEALFALQPVTFRYKKNIDPDRVPQFGLVAEEVEKVNPDLVVRDKEGKPYSVRYEQVNAMLLNEFLKGHRKVQQQEATIVQLEKDFRATVAAYFPSRRTGFANPKSKRPA